MGYERRGFKYESKVFGQSKRKEAIHRRTDESGGGSEATVSRVPLGHAKLEISLASKSRCHEKDGVMGREFTREGHVADINLRVVWAQMAFRATRPMSSSKEGMHLETRKGLEKEGGLKGVLDGEQRLEPQIVGLSENRVGEPARVN